MKYLPEPALLWFDHVNRYPPDGPVMIPVEIAAISRFNVLMGTPISTEAKLDSGADSCVFPADFAPVLGIDLTRAETVRVRGFSGPEFELQESPVLLRICGEWLLVRAVFDPQIEVRDGPLIGREGVFDRFRFGIAHGQGRLLAAALPMGVPAA